MRNILFGGLVMLLLLAACQSQEKKEKVFKGYVIWDEDYTTFTDCETQKTYWLDDKTEKIGEQYKSLAKAAYSEVYFELKADLLPPSTVGVSSSFDNVMAVKEVVKYSATPPQSACVNKNEKPYFSCFGENPNWTFGFGRDIKFTANYPNDTVVYFPFREPEIRDSANVGRVFYYNIGNENFQNIQLIITEQPCKAGKKFYRFSSKVLFGGEEYKGCASIKMINDEEYSNN
jgi:uncharacterized membrane protein